MTETPKAPTMEPAQLREEFTKQLADANEKISKAETELIRLREYRTKLQGGLETLGILTGDVNAEPLPTPETETPETPPTE
tara:strand:- start:1571 stop:1813 length:243 start_codon:yes stop_codon:yes gene_type:complete